jgi:hypothetical protein
MLLIIIRVNKPSPVIILIAIRNEKNDEDFRMDRLKPNHPPYIEGFAMHLFLHM